MKQITSLNVTHHCEELLNTYGFVYPLTLRWHCDDVRIALDNSHYSRDWSLLMQRQVLEDFFLEKEEEITQFINERLVNYVEDRIEANEIYNE